MMLLQSFPGKNGTGVKNFCVFYREVNDRFLTFRSKYRKAGDGGFCEDNPLTNVRERSIILNYYS